MRYSHYVACAMRYYYRHERATGDYKPFVENFKTCARALKEFSDDDCKKIKDFYLDGKTNYTDFQTVRRFEKIWAEMRGI